MIYAKYVDGCLVYAPRMIKDGDTVTYNPTVETLIGLGYKPVRDEEKPVCEDGYHCEVEYTETDSEIIHGWVIVKDSDEVNADEVLSAIEEIL